MRRRAIVVFALLASLLAVTAIPVSAVSTNTAVGSIHQNDTDFNNAAQLSNATVQGTGADAFVQADLVELDQLTKWALDDDSTSSTAVDSWSSNDGSITGATYTTNSISGNALDFDGAGDYVTTSSTFDATTNDSVTISIWVNPDQLGNNADDDWFVQYYADSNNRIGIAYDSTDDEIVYWLQVDGTRHDVQVAESNRLSSGSWHQLAVKVNNTNIEGYYNGSSIASSTHSTTVSNIGSGNLNVARHSADLNLYFDGQGDDVRVYDGEVTASNIESLYNNPGADPTQTTATYISATHQVDNAQTGFANISTLTNVEATVAWQESSDGGSSWTDVATNTFTTAGNHTIDISSATNSDLRVNVTFVITGDNPTAELHDEGVLFTNHEPGVDNSTGSPTGELTTTTPTLSINVSDGEFGTAQGETVTVEFFVDGSSVGTDTLSSNGTASLSVSNPLTGGDHTWHAVASDEYGGQNTSQTFSITVPSMLEIREEQPPHDRITSAKVTVKFYEQTDDNPTIIERTATDGNVSLAGLPVGSEFVATANASGYYNRSVLITDIFEQETVFLLDQGQPSVENTFVIEDRTGDFSPGDSKLRIQKAVNRSVYGGSPDGFTWTTMAGDELGADQSFTVDLRTQSNNRYRLIVENDAGDSRILGAYNAETSGVITLQIGTVSISPDDSETYAVSADYTTVDGSKFINFQFNDPTDSTTDLRLVIHEYGNATNEIENSTHAGPYGTFSFNKNLTAISSAAENKEWVVSFEATRDGDTISGSRVVGREGIGEGIDALDPLWLHVGSVGLLFLLSGLVGGMVNPGAGAMVLAGVGGIFWYMQLLPPEIGGGAIAFGMLVAAGYTAATSQGGAIR